MIYYFMNYIRYILGNSALYLYTLYKNWFYPHDYDIYKTNVIFSSVTGAIGLWNDHEYCEGPNYFKCDRQDLKTLMETKPLDVSDIRIETTYWHDSKKYKHVSSDIEWPPGTYRSNGNVTLPIKSATLVTLNDMYDVTNKVKKYAGPRSDFHGHEIIIEDIFHKWDEKDLQFYDFLEIEDIIGQKREIMIQPCEPCKNKPLPIEQHHT